MTGEEFNRRVRALIPDLLDEVGSVLHSPVSTVCPGDIYVLGINPGKPKTARTLNDYFDWRLTEPDRHSLVDAHNSPFHRRTAELLKGLGYDVRKVCFSNLAFVSTPRSATLARHIPAMCWPVHRLILDVVRPRVILSLGNSGLSAYSFLQEQPSFEQGPTQRTGHGTYAAKSLRGTIDERPVIVIGIPHPSQFVIKDLIGVCRWASAMRDGIAKSVL